MVYGYRACVRPMTYVGEGLIATGHRPVAIRYWLIGDGADWQWSRAWTKGEGYDLWPMAIAPTIRVVVATAPPSSCVVAPIPMGWWLHIRASARARSAPHACKCASSRTSFGDGKG